MAQFSRAFRIFVRFTFSDLKAEREALQREVFPGCGSSAYSTAAASRPLNSGGGNRRGNT